MLKEFKAFALKGNMVDMAVGIIIGAAFGKIITSLVNDIIMPPLNFFTRGIAIQDKFLIFSGQKFATLKEAQEAGIPLINYGNFIQLGLTFLIVAFALFLIVKAMNMLRKKEEVVGEPPKNEKLLAEIRDLLKKEASPIAHSKYFSGGRLRRAGFRR